MVTKSLKIYINFVILIWKLLTLPYFKKGPSRNLPNCTNLGSSFHSQSRPVAAGWVSPAGFHNLHVHSSQHSQRLIMGIKIKVTHKKVVWIRRITKTTITVAKFFHACKNSHLEDKKEVTFLQGISPRDTHKNKPAAQAAGADPSR